MKKYYYDLHIHSCLSPCADNDSTPANIAGMASLSGFDILALTDHNSVKNCPAFFASCKRYGIVPIAGMELTTSEDIHVVCLFRELESALEFDKLVNSKRFLIKNRPDIFGEQLIVDEFDNVISTEENLLSNATSISIEDVPALVKKFGGISYPAHIDRTSNGAIAVLGAFPETKGYSCFELRDEANEESYRRDYALGNRKMVVSSDAHNLTDILDAKNAFLLDTESNSEASVCEALFRYLDTEETK